MRVEGPHGYFVSDDRSLVDVGRVHHWLSVESYWATGRSLEAVERSIENSLTLGLYSPTSEMAGLCRWVTDYASFAWLCDVFVDRGHRGKGAGTFLVGTAAALPVIKDLRLQLLATKDAHGLYERFGFVALPEPSRWMERRAPASDAG